MLVTMLVSLAAWGWYVRMYVSFDIVQLRPHVHDRGRCYCKTFLPFYVAIVMMIYDLHCRKKHGVGGVGVAIQQHWILKESFGLHRL